MEGAGNAGCSPHPQPRVENRNTRVSHHRFAEAFRHSLRNGFNGLLRALSGDRALLSPSPAKTVSADLAPASGRQDHTTSPSAPASLVWQHQSVHRIPPNVRDDGQRPSLGRDGRSCRRDLPVGLSRIFLRTALDRSDTQLTDLPVGQIKPCTSQDALQASELIAPKDVRDAG
jgi:hypothetical protein